MKDPYSTLGVSKTAPEDEIKKAFRRLAHEHHPDKGGDPQKFKDVNEAYQILGDKEKRAKYDQFGSAAFEQGGFGGGPGFSGGFNGFDGMNVNFSDLGDLGDILGDMFGFGGGARGRAGSVRGADIQVELSLDFLETVTGVAKKIPLLRHQSCGACTGSGAAPGSKVESCKTCQGRGQVMRQVRTMFGTMQTAARCPECEGRGQMPSKPCPTCAGSGVERKKSEITIQIPPGIDEGEVLQVTGEGEHPGRGGHPGDLIVRIQVKPHSVFRREGRNVRSTIEIPYSTLALGGSVEVETVDGPGSIEIKDGTSPGTVYQIKGKGMPALRSATRGDHLILVQAKTPVGLSKAQRDALEALRDAGL